MSALAKEAVAPVREPGWELLDEHSADFLRLQRVLKSGCGFRLILCQFNAPLYRDHVIAQVNAALASPSVWTLPADPNPDQFEAQLAEHSDGHDCLHLVGLDRWLAQDQEGVLRLLNYHREQIGELAPLPLLLWISPAQVAPFARQAPDMWAWRAAVLDFTLSTAVAATRPIGPRLSLGNAGAAQSRQRIIEITEYLAARPTPTNADAALLLEAADLSHQLGEWTKSQGYAERALRIYERTNNRRGAAIAHGRVANILSQQGRLEDALQIRRAKELPIYERLSDHLPRAYTLGKIAETHSDRGEWDEALRILRDEALPIHERLGNEHGQAVTLARIADILYRRGDLAEARRIHQDEVLPLFRHLDSSLECAATLSRIATIDRSNGNLEVALKMLQGDVMPVYERLGAVHSRAIAFVHVADILFEKGDFDEALRTLRDESLDIFARLGDEHGHAICLGRIANILQQRGELDEALRIRRDKELPVYQRLGDIHGRLSCQANIALILLAQTGDGPAGASARAEAEALLCQSLADAHRLGIGGEIEAIKGAIAKHGLHCPET